MARAEDPSPSKEDSSMIANGDTPPPSEANVARPSTTPAEGKTDTEMATTGGEKCDGFFSGDSHQDPPEPSCPVAVEDRAPTVRISSEPTEITNMSVGNSIDAQTEDSQVTADDIIDSLQKNRVPNDTEESGISQRVPADETSTPHVSGMGIKARIRSRGRGEKIGHRREVDGNVTYKQTKASDLMMGLQLGIQHSIGRLAGVDVRDILMEDFDEIEDVNFPKEGSPTTQAHTASTFRLLTYAPRAFRYFRAVFGIEPADFMISLCNEPLKEVTNAGASGSLFYISLDDNYIMKTVQSKEAHFLRKLLPGYFLNITQNTKTLLPKFFGLYCYQSLLGRHIRLVIMNNVLPTHVSYHEKFDLKGSTYGRLASERERAKATPTLKDLDFLETHPNGICLERNTYNALMRTLKRDVRVMESFGIMDYSLLVGVHYFSETSAKALKQKAQQAHQDRNYGFTSLAETLSIQQANADFGGGILGFTASGKPLLLFAGIIDILQQYRVAKKLEHFFKSTVYDGKTVSVCHPTYYQQRFIEFIGSVVFKPISIEKVRDFMHHRQSEMAHDLSVRTGAALAAKSTVALTIAPGLEVSDEPLPPNQAAQAQAGAEALEHNDVQPGTADALGSNASEVIGRAMAAAEDASTTQPLTPRTQPGRLRAQSEYMTSRIGSAPEMHMDNPGDGTPAARLSPAASRYACSPDYCDDAIKYRIKAGLSRLVATAVRSAVSPSAQARLLRKPIERVSSLDNFVSSKLFDGSDVNLTQFRSRQ